MDPTKATGSSLKAETKVLVEIQNIGMLVGETIKLTPQYLALDTGVLGFIDIAKLTTAQYLIGRLPREGMEDKK